MAMSEDEIQALVQEIKTQSATEPASDQHGAAVRSGGSAQQDFGPAGNFAAGLGQTTANIIGAVKSRGQQNSLEEFDRALGSTIARVQNMEDGPEKQYAMQNVSKAIGQREKFAKMKGNILRYLDSSGLPETKEIGNIIKKVGKGDKLSAKEYMVVGRVMAQAEGDQSLLKEAIEGDPKAAAQVGKFLENRYKTATSQLRYGKLAGSLAEPELPKEVTDRVAVEGSVGGALDRTKEEKDVETTGKKLDNELKWKNLNEKKEKETKGMSGDTAKLNALAVEGAKMADRALDLTKGKSGLYAAISSGTPFYDPEVRKAISRAISNRLRVESGGTITVPEADAEAERTISAFDSEEAVQQAFNDAKTFFTDIRAGIKGQPTSGDAPETPAVDTSSLKDKYLGR